MYTCMCKVKNYIKFHKKFVFNIVYECNVKRFFGCQSSIFEPSREKSGAMFFKGIIFINFFFIILRESFIMIFTGCVWILVNAHQYFQNLYLKEQKRRQRDRHSFIQFSVTVNQLFPILHSTKTCDMIKIYLFLFL